MNGRGSGNVRGRRKLRKGEIFFLIMAAAVIAYVIPTFSQVVTAKGSTPRMSFTLKGAALQGQAEFQTLGCINCHMIYNSLGDINSAGGGAKNLGGVGSEYTVPQLVHFLTHPSQTLCYETLGEGDHEHCASFWHQLSPQTVSDLAQFLETLKAPAGKGHSAMPIAG